MNLCTMAIGVEMGLFSVTYSIKRKAPRVTATIEMLHPINIAINMHKTTQTKIGVGFVKVYVTTTKMS